MPTYAVVTAQTQPRKPKGGRVVTSHLTHSKPVDRKKRYHFLNLAGELRNQIYGYVFDSGALVKMIPEGRVERVTPSRGTFFKLSHNQLSYTPTTPQKKVESTPMPTLRCTRVLGKYNRVEALNTKWATSFSGLILTCRQVHREAILYLYASTTFSFHSPNRLHSFLTVVQPANLAAIKRLHLTHATYGQPYDPGHNVWKAKHDEKWARTCALAAANLPHLEELKISLDVLDVPLQFNLKAAWIQPLLLFGRLALKSAEVHLSSMYTSRPVSSPPSACRTHEAYVALHQLFADAIGRKILGWDDDSAVEAYRTSCLGKYKDYIAVFNRNEHWKW